MCMSRVVVMIIICLSLNPHLLLVYLSTLVLLMEAEMC